LSKGIEVDKLCPIWTELLFMRDGIDERVRACYDLPGMNEDRSHNEMILMYIFLGTGLESFVLRYP